MPYQGLYFLLLSTCTVSGACIFGLDAQCITDIEVCLFRHKMNVLCTFDIVCRYVVLS